MLNRLDDKQWEILLGRIKDGMCTPFLGAGACFGTLKLGQEIAEEWAKKHNYPLADSHNLARVGQYLSIEYQDAKFPKEKILRDFFKGVLPPDFRKDNEPHGVLASLPLPIYMTTNYDDFMYKALVDRGKDARRELCRWNKYIKIQPSIFESDFDPTPDKPVVFHLHGHNDIVESLVLTEDDYLDFLVNISRDQSLLPPRIQRSLAQTSLLFIGYSLSDWDFRVLFRGLIMATERFRGILNITVQLPPHTISSTSTLEQAKSYLDKYFGNFENTRVYWGTAQEFMSELRTRWESFSK